MTVKRSFVALTITLLGSFRNHQGNAFPTTAFTPQYPSSPSSTSITSTITPKPPSKVDEPKPGFFPKNAVTSSSSSSPPSSTTFSKPYTPKFRKPEPPSSNSTSTTTLQQQPTATPPKQTKTPPQKRTPTLRSTKEARIISLSLPNDPNNAPLENITAKLLPPGATLLQVGSTLSDLDIPLLNTYKANVAFVSPGITSTTLAQVLDAVPSIQWIHSRSAGIDGITSSALARSGAVVTNAKGAFSSTLAEYALMACNYFAKDLRHMLENRRNKEWKSKYPVLELKGATFGIVGYGDIGRATAKLAKAYGMKVMAIRKNVPSAEDVVEDPYCDIVYEAGKEALNRVFARCDYVLCAAPLTAETYRMIGKEQFDVAKEGCVFINVGRSPIVDEPALIEALKDGRLKGAGLDVFTNEALEEENELWSLDNVLLNSRNRQMTDRYLLESTQFFIRENLPRFLRGETLLNQVDKKAGY